MVDPISDRIAAGRGRVLQRLLILLMIAAVLQIARTEVLAQSAGRALEAAEEIEQADGATVRFMTFQSQNRALRYNPPSDWTASLAGGKATFAKGNMTATLSVSSDGAPSRSGPIPPTPEQLRQFADETLAKVPGKDGAPPVATLLPFALGNLVFAESTASYKALGRSHSLQRVRSYGSPWQVQIEISGPQEEFDKLAGAFVRSVCNMEMRDAREQQAAVAIREREALDRIATASQAPAASPTSNGKRRGILP